MRIRLPEDRTAVREVGVVDGRDLEAEHVDGAAQEGLGHSTMVCERDVLSDAAAIPWNDASGGSRERAPARVLAERVKSA